VPLHHHGHNGVFIHSRILGRALLDRWLLRYELPDKKTVVVVDEAGMVGTRQMH